MMASEAMVETFVRQKVNTVFGIVGSAFMDALDLFPEAGIRFLAGKRINVFNFMFKGPWQIGKFSDFLLSWQHFCANSQKKVKLRIQFPTKVL